MQLQSKYFALSEFEAAGFPVAPTPLEKFLLKNLVTILDPIREALGFPLHVNDCYRTEAKYQKLMLNGHHPSPTSDHFWGQAMPTSPAQAPTYGPFFTMGVGAVDLGVGAADIEAAFAKIRALKLPLGQCILEQSGPSSKWIHIANPKTLCYSQRVLDAVGLNPHKYMRSRDGGLTYEDVT